MAVTNLNHLTGHDHSPVAIALGDDESDAREVAHRATLDDFPAPRTIPAPAVHVDPGGEQ